MLKEFKNLRQVVNISRRLFSDDFFDLYLWYKKNTEEFFGFQLVFNVSGVQMALTAEAGKTPSINRLDSGDDEFYSQTNILNGTGYFPKKQLIEEFQKRSDNIDNIIRESILNVIDLYKEEKQSSSEPYEALRLCSIY